MSRVEFSSGVHGFLRWNAGNAKGLLLGRKEKRRGKGGKGGGDTEGGGY